MLRACAPHCLGLHAPCYEHCFAMADLRRAELLYGRYKAHAMRLGVCRTHRVDEGLLRSGGTLGLLPGDALRHSVYQAPPQLGQACSSAGRFVAQHSRHAPPLSDRLSDPHNPAAPPLLAFTPRVRVRPPPTTSPAVARSQVRLSPPVHGQGAPVVRLVRPYSERHTHTPQTAVVPAGGIGDVWALRG